MLKRKYINMKNDDMNASPITFKMYELKILHNMLVESLEEYPNYPMDVVILNKIKEEIQRIEVLETISALFGKLTTEEENYWNTMEAQYKVETEDDLLF
jgi:hypothetical protein